MSQILSLGLRPEKLSDLFGQSKTINAVRSHMATRPPRVWLFSGEPGTGKTTLARIMAVAYQCGHMKIWGDPCEECMKNRKHWAIHEVNAADLSGAANERSGVENMEKLAAIADRFPLAGSKRVIIVDEYQALSAAAFRVLLKPTEDTPDHAVWIFCTSNLAKVPAANQRRPVKYALRTLNMTEAETFLRAAATKAGVTLKLNPLIEAVQTLGVGSPGVLLQALEKYAAGCPANDSVMGADGADLDMYNLGRALTSGDWVGVLRHLSDATPDSARSIRAFAASWLKGGLVSPKLKLTPKQQEAAALGLIDLADAPFDDAMMLYWLHGVLWKIARRYKP